METFNNRDAIEVNQNIINKIAYLLRANNNFEQNNIKNNLDQIIDSKIVDQVISKINTLQEFDNRPA